ncbi:MAG: glycosyltransferase family 2 protein, partial [Candidatus Cloacimonetes bacterium]|nr:glycosyltransferase family 2 protein [Candidatus Cloacimonadota bacterium]
MFDTYPLVYIIIVTWNSREHLEYCLPTVFKTDYPNYKVLIVDNNSEDDTVDFVRNNYPDIELIQNTKNRGFAGGNNDGIRYALAQGVKYICIINPDIKVDPRWIENAVKIMGNSLKTGILGFNVFGEHRYEDPYAHQFEKAKASWSKLEVSIVPSQEIISGCALFVKADIFRNLGLFDEKYFCYGEESDLEHRVRRAGYGIVRINVPLWHEGEGSSKRIPIKKSYLEMRNSIRYALKNLSPRQ